MSSDILSAPRLVFAREAVEQLSQRRREPEWLLAMRVRALAAFERLPLPDQRTEGWRRTSLRGLSLDGFDPLQIADTPRGQPDDVLARQAGARFFAYGNGVVTRADTLNNGRVVELQDALQEPVLAALLEKHFGQVVAPESDKFTALHYAFFNAGVLVFAPRGAAIAQPIWLNYTFDQPGQAALVHTLIIAADEADVRVIEDYQGDADGLASGVVEQVLGANAHLRYVHLQRWAEDVWNFSTQRARLDQDASIRTLNVAAGGRMTRNSLQVMLEGRGGQADILGVAATHGRQHVDFQTLQDHSGNATRSDLIIHNALRDRSSTNFTGLIRINKPAHQTESSQEQKNILLSPGAKADSDPKLEILNNDVIRCTHGAAVGPVDQEMIFYLASRGLDLATAERLIVEGFFQSTLKKLDLPAVEEAIWSAIAETEQAEESLGE
ncbi:MAG: Fe-S cluster assembly protein SufD [Chloroflexi bacterium]|nr:Fe-S cluster assembly protein SufD [Chloroflexota bacterium]